MLYYTTAFFFNRRSLRSDSFTQSILGGCLSPEKTVSTLLICTPWNGLKRYINYALYEDETPPILFQLYRRALRALCILLESIDAFHTVVLAMPHPPSPGDNTALEHTWVRHQLTTSTHIQSNKNNHVTYSLLSEHPLLRDPAQKTQGLSSRVSNKQAVFLKLGASSGTVWQFQKATHGKHGGLDRLMGVGQSVCTDTEVGTVLVDVHGYSASSRCHSYHKSRSFTRLVHVAGLAWMMRVFTVVPFPTCQR